MPRGEEDRLGGGGILRPASNRTGALMDTSPDIFEAVRTFQAEGYKHDFRAEGARLFDVTADREIEPDDIQVDASFRFEEAPDGADVSVLYAISDRKHGTKGLVIDAFDLI